MPLKNSNEFADISAWTGLSAETLDLVKTICRSQSGVESVILFGSRAKGNWKRGSDIDLCLKGKSLTHKELTSISFTLNEETLLPYMFDLLLWHTIQNEEIAAHIERCGIIL